MNNFTLEAEKICNSVEDIAKGNLNNKEDLLRITELALKNNNLSLLEDLSFHAKFSQGLISIIQKSDNKIDDDYFEKVKVELIKSLEKVKRLFEELLIPANDFLKTIFKEKYLEMTQQCLANLQGLCSDLGYLKFYLNDVQRNTGSH